jgi:hypothetical protein
MLRRKYFLDLALLSLCAGILSFQLFIPPLSGLANNGDFARIIGSFSMGPRAHGWSYNFDHFVSEYKEAPQFSWRSGVWSTELPLAWIATRISLPAWDIRWIGLVHSCLFLLALAAFLRLITGAAAWKRALLGVLIILVSCDLAYVAYFNSFYQDTAALLGLWLTVVAALWMERRPPFLSSICFAAAALLLIGSKPQHAWVALLAAAWLIAHSRIWLGAVVLIAGLLMPLSIPSGMRRQPLFSVLFFQLLRNSPDVVADARELHLSPEEMRYAGLHAYSDGSPANDPAYLIELERRCSFACVGSFYLHHPMRTLGYVSEVVRTQAFQLQPFNLATDRAEDAGKRHFHLTLWSGLRSRWFVIWPWHVVVWYGAVIVAAVYFRQWLLFGLAIMGIGELCIASLADATETFRHLILFHAVTDTTVLFAIGCIVLQNKSRNRRSQSHTSRRTGSMPGTPRRNAQLL